MYINAIHPQTSGGDNTAVEILPFLVITPKNSNKAGLRSAFCDNLFSTNAWSGLLLFHVRAQSKFIELNLKLALIVSGTER